MSGKGNRGGGKKIGGGNSGGGGGPGSGSRGSRPAPEPTIVTGHQYHTYSRGSGGDRYVYIGKDEDTGEPEFLDYGPKGGR
mmetsp:Transcript_17393/g.42255  ORF Transcript_17393/g.42255 Transcript_17393/m.42255 type:complete len:81 (-) Transcript_17393:2062-2304(-)|eukprot:CAMPEP_0113482468 /NCGR_PEP_ID=MMETSP0014_2-20120614/22934_1 /TAXON_ID=2857 /ORGANISM="Nitzschia sp." /LENGTH=80 /DNA_ID=CAMNT_0000375985 /DNA_START=68 /DNA_END=310 /DNA_ORIENTATION=+ /assembly_acc=CAM_ASM_000159